MPSSPQLSDLLTPGSAAYLRKKQPLTGSPPQPQQPVQVPYRQPEQPQQPPVKNAAPVQPPLAPGHPSAAPAPATAATPPTPAAPGTPPSSSAPAAPAPPSAAAVPPAAPPPAPKPAPQPTTAAASAPAVKPQPPSTPPTAQPSASQPPATPPAQPPAAPPAPPKNRAEAASAMREQAAQKAAAEKAAAEKQQSPPQPAAPTTPPASPPAAPTTAPSAQTPAAAPSAATTSAPTSPPAAAATPPAAPQQQPVRPMNRGEAAEARRLADAQKHGAVIQNGKTVPHPDGKGLLHHEGFVTVQTPAPHGRGPATQGPTTTIPYREDPDKGTTVPYRDDHGTHHQIPINDITRVAGPDGKAEYHFMVGGKPVSVPEGQTPLFQVDKDGRRYTTAPDGTRRDLGADLRTMAQNGVAPREEAADKSLQEKLAQGAELQRQLQQKQAQAAAAQQRLDAAQQAVAAPFKDTGPESQTQRIHAQEEVIHAEAALKQQQQELQALQKQHDAHYSAIGEEQRARQIEIGLRKSAAAASPHDAQWQKDSASMQGDTRATHLRLIAEAEKKDPASAEAMRRALVPEPTQRLFAAAEKSFGGAQPPEGKSISLHDLLMQAPEVTQGKDTRQTTVDQAAAARATAQNSLGITDPENVRVTRSADGSYSLSRPAADGTHQPFATLDPKTNRITLTPGADGKFTQAAADLAAKSSATSTPVYLSGGQPPLSEAQVSALIQKGISATTSTTDRKAADAALTQAGLSPQGIAQMVNEGRLSVQDGQLLNNKFNSGVSSYAQRDAAATGRQQDATLQQIYQSGKGTPDKPSFQSWMDKGDPRRDSQVRDMAQKMGVSEDAVRRDLETRRIMDWSTPLTQQSHDAQSGVGNAFMRGLGLGTAPEATRTLPDGTLMPNPMLGSDRSQFDAAIDAAQATPEAKAKAKELWGQYHDSYLTNARPALETMQTLPGVENYTAWRERMQKNGDFNHLTENQKAEQYMEEQKKRGSLVKVLDTIGSNLIAGSHDLVSGIAGTAGLLTGSQTLSDYAAEKARQADQSTAALQYTGSDGLLHNVIGGLARAAPGLAAAAATGGTAGGAAVAFVQGAGSTYTDLYQHHIDQGMDPKDAHKAAAGTAIASGVVSAALGKVMPHGAQALNNPATREAAKKAFGATLKAALKGGAEEIGQEAIDSGFNHIASEMNKGRTFQEAATSFAEQFPQSALTSALLGGGTEAASTLRKGGTPTPQQPAQPQQAQPPSHVAPSGQPNGKMSFSTVDAEGREIPPSDTPEPTTIAPAVIPRPAAAGESSSGPQIPQSTTTSGPAPGKEAPATAPDSPPPSKPGSATSAQTGIPENTTQSPADAPPGMEPSKEAAAAGQVMTMENGGQVLDTIDRLKAKEQNGALTKDEQIELHHNENLLALAQVTNLEAKQKALSKLPTPRDLHPTELAALAKAKAMLARPWPGTAPASTTQSSSGSLPPGDTSTTQGVTPPTGIATGTPTGTANTGGTTVTTGTGSTTSTASSGGTIPPSTGSESGTHTTNGVTAPPVGHGNLIPENTTQPEHIDLANRRTENLEEVARKRPLSEHEQEVYDNARRVRDRNAPAQPGDRNSPPPPPGSRNTSDPDHLAMSGDADALVPVTPDGEDATLDAEADIPPADVPAQPANAVGTTIEGAGAANPDAPTASADTPTPPPPTGPAGAPQTAGSSPPTPTSPPSSSTPPATASGIATTTASGSTSSNVSGSPSSPPSTSTATSNSGNGNTQTPSYPPIDYDHIVGGDVNAQGTRVTGGHSLHRGDVRIIPGTELPPNAAGVYRAQVQIKHPTTGVWTTKANHNGTPITNTMFPKNWSEHKIKAEIDAAWASPSKVITGNRWMSVTPSGVRIIGYINTSPHLNRVTAYPDY